MAKIKRTLEFDTQPVATVSGVAATYKITSDGGHESEFDVGTFHNDFAVLVVASDMAQRPPVVEGQAADIVFMVCAQQSIDPVDVWYVERVNVGSVVWFDADGAPAESPSFVYRVVNFKVDRLDDERFEIHLHARRPMTAGDWALIGIRPPADFIEEWGAVE